MTEAGDAPTDSPNPAVLVIDDDDATRMLITRWLMKGGIECFEAPSGEQGILIASERAHDIDAIVLDVMMPGIDGFEVLQRLKANPVTETIPVVLLTAHANDEGSILRGVESGVVDHLAKPFSGPVLSAKVKAVCARSKEARALRTKLHFAERYATIDPLTGLFNRRIFDARLKEEAAHARRHGAPFSVAMLDLDHFKAVNDTYGHEHGDRVIIAFAAAVRAVLREDDMAFRFGGEEFVVIMRSCVAASAAVATDRLREYLAANPMEFGDTRKPIAFSAGIASADATNEYSASDLVARADAALYIAKRSGRGRSELALPAEQQATT